MVKYVLPSYGSEEYFQNVSHRNLCSDFPVTSYLMWRRYCCFLTVRFLISRIYLRVRRCNLFTITNIIIVTIITINIVFLIPLLFYHQVSAAFAEAESSGKLFNIAPVKVDAEGLDEEMEGDGEQDIFGRDGVKGVEDGQDSGGEEELPIRKMASMSLAARVKMKFGDTSSAPPAVRRLCCCCSYRFLYCWFYWYGWCQYSYAVKVQFGETSSAPPAVRRLSFVYHR